MALGVSFLWLRGMPSIDLTVVVNAFSQVLVVSVAEIVVCWCLVATAVKHSLLHRGPAFATILAALVASALFGLYHFAHSPPFNTWPMVAVLFTVGLATSAFFFVSRDAAGTLVFHNVLATFGVLRALADASALESFQTLQPALLAMERSARSPFSPAMHGSGRRTPAALQPSVCRNPSNARFTSAGRSCCVQWPHPGSRIFARSIGTNCSSAGSSSSMPLNATTRSRSPAT